MWLLFGALVTGMLTLDLGVINRQSRALPMKQAGLWSAAWVTLACLFAAGVFHFKGSRPASEFLTGYLVEWSLSVDNLFVFIVIFDYFAVPARYQHRVLFWGILGAVMTRGLFIVAGLALIKQFHGLIYAFGALLIYTGVKILFQKDEKMEPEKNAILKLFKRFMPVKTRHDGEEFFVKEAGIWVATPLFATLLVIEASDIFFAVDSIPAIFGITQDPFIIYTSNIFAILGLRSLYFLLAGIMPLFRFLKIGLAAILCFIGLKMLFSALYAISAMASLLIVASLLALSVIASVLIKSKG